MSVQEDYGANGGMASPDAREVSPQPALDLQLEDLTGDLGGGRSLAGALQAEPSPQPDDTPDGVEPGDLPCKSLAYASKFESLI